MPPDPQGTPPDGAGQGDGPKYVTEEQLNATVNKAISTRLTEFAKKQTKDIETVLGTYSEQLKADIAELVGTKPNDEGGKKEQTPAPKEGDSPELRGMRKELEAMKKKLGDAEVETAREKAAAKDVKLRQIVLDELTKNGFTDAKLAVMARGQLIDVEKRIKLGEDDAAIFIDIDDGSEVDMSTGIKRWSATDDAKVFKPAKGSRGSGGSGGGNNNRGSNGSQKTGLGALLAGHLTGQDDGNG